MKVYDGELMPGVSVPYRFQIVRLLTRSIRCFQSKYKSLLISERTTVDELIKMLLNCYNSNEKVEQFSIYEVN